MSTLLRTAMRRSRALSLLHTAMNGRLLLSLTAPSLTIAAHRHTKVNRPRHIGKKIQELSIPADVVTEADEDTFLSDTEYDSIASSTMHVHSRLVEQKVLVIQPYVKWGPRKADVKPEHQLQEAEALVRSIPSWMIVKSIKVGLESLDKRSVFGTGKLEELRQLVAALQDGREKLTTVFISKSMLTRPQKVFLEQHFHLPVLDRYSVVVQILRLHAVSAEAKLQVAMAEIPYIWQQMRDLDSAGLSRAQVFFTDTQKEMLKQREKKIKDELDRIRSQRTLLRKRRVKKSFPIVAVVGYTNAGKTSLIKALTDESSLQPRDQLFATLDVTSHAGFLPCKLEVLYMDTVGFMSDIPTGLIECFIATLEDAMLADVIIHVQDVAHENYEQQKKHVEETLRQLQASISSIEGAKLPPIIDVGNKVDLVNDSTLLDSFQEHHLVSSTTKSGINDLLAYLENAVLQTTNRKKMIIKVRNGGEEAAWLYKNTAVTKVEADENNSDQLMMHVVISEAVLQKFKSEFINGNGASR